jgi:hypothetical protein
MGTAALNTGCAEDTTKTVAMDEGAGDEDDTGATTGGIIPDEDTGGGPGNDSATSGADGPGDSAPDDDGNAEGGFIDEPDGGITGQCDPGAQDCPRGQKCSSYVTMPGQETVDATHCVEVTGNDEFGEECERIEGNDSCVAGFFCMTTVSGSTGPGICLEYCQVGQACEFGGECFAFNDGALPLCEVTCNPLASTCPQGQGCFAAFDNFVCATPGFPDGGGGDGAPCATIQGCQPGLLCRGGTAGCEAEGSCCTPVCDLSEAEGSCAEAEEQCIAALDKPPPDLTDVGYCGVPQ